MVLVLALGDLHVPHRAVDIPPKFKALLVPGKIQQVLCTGNLCHPTSGYEFCKGIAPDVRIVRAPMDEIASGIALPTLDAAAQTSDGDAARPSGIGGLVGAANPLNWPATAVVTHGTVRIGLCSSYLPLPGTPLRAAGDDRALVAQLGVQLGAAAAASEQSLLAMLQSLQQLAVIARKLNVDVLVTGGGGHQFAAVEWAGRLYVNPGSATGAFDPDDLVLVRSAFSSQVAHQVELLQRAASPEAASAETAAAAAESPVAAAPKEAATSEAAESKEETHGEMPKAEKAGPYVAHLERPVPSFVLMDIQANHIVLYIYKLVDGDVKVEKMEFTKKLY